MNVSPDLGRNHRQGPRGLMWPVLLILLGSMFLLGQFVPGWGFGKTWPALLIVVGAIKLFESTQAPRPPQGPRV
jgi:membrane-bound ClpP family serine protease